MGKASDNLVTNFSFVKSSHSWHIFYEESLWFISPHGLYHCQIKLVSFIIKLSWTSEAKSLTRWAANNNINFLTINKVIYFVKCVWRRKVSAKSFTSMMIVGISFQCRLIKVYTKNYIISCHFKPL